MFFDFFGKGARKDLEAANQQASASLEQGKAGAIQVGDKYYGEGQNLLMPFAQSGRDADAAIRNALGLNGADAQRGYYNNFQTDPGFQNEVNAGVRTLDSSATARGGLYSGAQMKALQRFGQDKMSGAYSNRLNALMGYGQQGQQAATQQAGMAQQYGSDRMNLEYGYGQQRAGNQLNLGNALAQNRNVGMNNLLGIAGVAAKAYGAYK